MKRLTITAAVILIATISSVEVLASQAPFPSVRQMKFPYKATLHHGGSLRLTNTNGSITLHSGPGTRIEVEAQLTVRGVDDRAAADGIARTVLVTGGDTTNRWFRVDGTRSGFSGRWSSTVDWDISVPRSVNVTIDSNNSPQLTVDGMVGFVVVRNFNGAISINSPGGPVLVDTVNGVVDLRYSEHPTGDVRLSSLNGSIRVEVPDGTNSSWIAQTFKGDITASSSVSGVFNVINSTGGVFRARTGRARGHTIQASTITGQIILLSAGDDVRSVQSVIPESYRKSPDTVTVASDFNQFRDLFPRPPSARTFVFQQNRLLEDIQLRAPMGSIFLGDVRGSADIVTQAGEINIGRVVGNCTAESFGGPLNLGEIWGNLVARTSAGDVTIRSALAGGEIRTGGGSVTVFSAAGPLDIQSGGGDVTVRQTSSGVSAVTRSGDISITMSPDVQHAGIEAHTEGGNIILTLPANFGGSLEATIITSDTTGSIESAFPGLSLARETIGDRIRIRATGRLGAGGNKISLHASEGTIQIRKQ